jgi:hypothetical protein
MIKEAVGYRVNIMVARRMTGHNYYNNTNYDYIPLTSRREDENTLLGKLK